MAPAILRGVLVVAGSLSGLSGCALDFDRARARGCGSECAECCEADLVPGGSFDRGWDRSDDPSQAGVPVRGFIPQGAAPATVSSFTLDRYEVTRSRFERFISSYDAWRATGQPAVGAGAPPGDTEVEWLARWDIEELPTDAAGVVDSVSACGPQSGWLTGSQNEPINCIDWYIAYAFCIWDGGRLPTDAEWSYAASGGDEQRAFPWSSPPESRVIDRTFSVGQWTGSLQRVGSVADRDAARWGTHDLAGNVREWTLDSADGVTDYETPCVDCSVFIGGAGRVRRGGDYDTDEAHARTEWRSSGPREVPNLFTGLRCVR